MVSENKQTSTYKSILDSLFSYIFQTQFFNSWNKFKTLPYEPVYRILPRFKETTLCPLHLTQKLNFSRCCRDFRCGKCIKSWMFSFSFSKWGHICDPSLMSHRELPKFASPIAHDWKNSLKIWWMSKRHDMIHNKKNCQKKISKNKLWHLPHKKMTVNLNHN